MPSLRYYSDQLTPERLILVSRAQLPLGVQALCQGIKQTLILIDDRLQVFFRIEHAFNNEIALSLKEG
jgi:hypothetical protein